MERWTRCAFTLTCGTKTSFLSMTGVRHQSVADRSDTFSSRDKRERMVSTSRGRLESLMVSGEPAILRTIKTNSNEDLLELLDLE